MNLKQTNIVKKGIELTNVQEGTEPKRGRLTDATILSNRDVLLTNVSEYDFRLFINAKQRNSDVLKYCLLVEAFKPTGNYDFKAGTGKCIFRVPWLEQYSTWLAYSGKLMASYAFTVSSIHRL